MTSVERLRDIWRRELNDYPLLSLRWIRRVLQSEIWVVSEILLSVENGWDKNLCELVDFEVELKERPVGNRLVDESGLGEL